jgi:hypothetical protein
MSEQEQDAAMEKAEATLLKEWYLAGHVAFDINGDIRKMLWTINQAVHTSVVNELAVIASYLIDNDPVTLLDVGRITENTRKAMVFILHDAATRGVLHLKVENNQLLVSFARPTLAREFLYSTIKLFEHAGLMVVGSTKEFEATLLKDPPYEYS